MLKNDPSVQTKWAARGMQALRANLLRQGGWNHPYSYIIQLCIQQYWREGESVLHNTLPTAGKHYGPKKATRWKNCLGTSPFPLPGEMREACPPPRKSSWCLPKTHTVPVNCIHALNSSRAIYIFPTLINGKVRRVRDKSQSTWKSPQKFLLDYEATN